MTAQVGYSEVRTPFAAILRRAVEATPNAIGGAFADRTGEMVDAFAAGYDPHEWAILTAHYGVVLAHLQSAFGIWHYGGPEYFFVRHEQINVFVHVVDSGYFALLAVAPPVPIDETLDHLAAAARELRREMS